jgi:hypothetical protein
MAASLPKLERLFSKRKGLASPPAEPNDLSVANDALQHIFPAPSFIRPKSARMVARDEVLVTTPQSKRAYSMPEPQIPQVPAIPGHAYKTSSASTGKLPNSPTRPGSLFTRRAGAAVSALHEFRFPVPSGGGHHERGDVSPVELSSPLISPRHTMDAKSRSSPTKISIPPRADTPPGSDSGESSPKAFRDKSLPALPRNHLPTPGPSPEMAPVPDSRLGGSKSTEILDTALYSYIQRRLDSSLAKAKMRKAASHSNLTPTSHLPSSNTVLKEPSFNDFLDLSDEDIAETRPETPAPPPQHALPPTPPATASTTSSQCSSDTTSLLTLSPPYASRPATAAAFEAARIAARYNFDLVYVVNLWPENSLKAELSKSNTSTLQGPPRGTCLDSLDGPIVQARTGMTGRLLAAYGLSTVKSPFRISAAVHSKILKADGWIEYRNEDANQDEWTRGYACAFYTGKYGRRASADSQTSLPTTTGQQGVDRGIVFAAYRKPREDGSSGIGCTPAELDSMHSDAETLVEMLIDIHNAHRLRRPSSQRTHADDTGPMPLQRADIFV